jgi:hypothetical protein
MTDNEKYRSWWTQDNNGNFVENVLLRYNQADAGYPAFVSSQELNIDTSISYGLPDYSQMANTIRQDYAQAVYIMYKDLFLRILNYRITKSTTEEGQDKLVLKGILDVMLQTLTLYKDKHNCLHIYNELIANDIVKTYQSEGDPKALLDNDSKSDIAPRRGGAYMYKLQTLRDNIVGDLYAHNDHLFKSDTYKLLMDQLSAYKAMPTQSQEAYRDVIKAKLHKHALGEAIDTITKMNNHCATLYELMNKKQTTTQAIQSILRDMIWHCKTTWGFQSDMGDDKDDGANTIITLSIVPSHPPSNIHSQGTQNGQEGGGDTIKGSEVLSQTTRDIVMIQSDFHSASIQLRENLRKILYVAEHLAADRDTKLSNFASMTIVPKLNAVEASVITATHIYKEITENLVLRDPVLRVKEKQEMVDVIRASKVPASQSIFIDDKVPMIYMLKVVRIMLMFLAVRFASNYYMERYTTYAANRDAGSKDVIDRPPDIRMFMMMFLAVDALFQMLIFGVLITISFMAKSNRQQPRVLKIDDEFLMVYIADYFLTTCFISTAMILFSTIFMSKMYIDLPNMGRPTVDAYSTLMMTISIVTCIIPFFLIL